MTATAAAARLCPIRQPAPEPSRSKRRLNLIAPAAVPRHEQARPKRRVSAAERERLLLLHMPQVRLVAESLRVRLRFAMEFEDLVSYGVIGLLKAIERYDPARGVLLKTYAEHRIRGAILDGARAMDWLPRSMRQKERQYQKSVRDAETARSAASTMAASPATAPLQAVPKPVVRPITKIEVIQAGAELGIFEQISQQAGLRGLFGNVTDDPEVEFQRTEMHALLAHAASRLPERHRTVLDLYYRQELSMKRIGQILRIHESRVSQLHAAAVERLRSALAPALKPQEPAEAPQAKSKVPKTQRPPRKPPKCLVTAAQSSSVSTPMVSSAVSAT